MCPLYVSFISVFRPAQQNPKHDQTSTNFLSLNENETRVNTRAKANNFDKPRICTNTFAYSAIDDWNTLPNNVKGIKSENKFKESIKKTLIADARKDDMNPFVYY